MKEKTRVYKFEGKSSIAEESSAIQETTTAYFEFPSRYHATDVKPSVAMSIFHHPSCAVPSPLVVIFFRGWRWNIFHADAYDDRFLRLSSVRRLRELGAGLTPLNIFVITTWPLSEGSSRLFVPHLVSLFAPKNIEEAHETKADADERLKNEEISLLEEKRLLTVPTWNAKQGKPCALWGNKRSANRSTFLKAPKESAIFQKWPKVTPGQHKALPPNSAKLWVNTWVLAEVPHKLTCCLVHKGWLWGVNGLVRTDTKEKHYP